MNIYDVIKSIKLTSIQEANKQLSFAWKKQSYSLLTSAETKDDFADAVLWCGKNGHALRGLKLEERNKFVMDISEKLFGKTSTEIVFGKVFKNDGDMGNRKAYSWESKLCHILNPFDNPIIYDSKTRRFFRVSTKEAWNRKYQDFFGKYYACIKELSREAVYELDSTIWTCDGQLSYEDVEAILLRLCEAFKWL